MLQDRVKIKILQYGKLYQKLDYDYIKRFKSDIFEVIDCATFDLKNGSYTDKYWEKVIDSQKNTLILAITNVPLEKHFYSRILSHHRIIFSFAEIYEYFKEGNIRLEDVIITELYRYAIIVNFRSLSQGFRNDLWHEETRGCLYDVDDNLKDVIQTYKATKICEQCIGKLRHKGISLEKLEVAKSELERLASLKNPKKSWYYVIKEKLYRHPYWTLLLTIAFAVLCDFISLLVLGR